MTLPGGFSTHPLLKKQYLPIATATTGALGFLTPASSAPADDDDDGSMVRTRSPRMMTSAWMMDLPPRMMFCVPMIWERRETLLPVSCVG
jgi:hypothetical protein